MTNFFVDTSALIKRYINEPGSAWVISWITLLAGNLIIISDIAEVEAFSAFARREREGTISSTLTQTFRNDFLYHCENEYLVVEIDRSIIANARQLITMYPLRTLDALQLSCAVYAKATLNSPVTFVSADRVLLTTASAEGFVIDDPNLHP